MPHLVVDISAHGFGHAGQCLPVVQALSDRVPGLSVTLRSALPAAKLAEHLGRDFAAAPPPPDVGMAMHGPIEIDAAASATAYLELHRDWDDVVRREAARLSALRPDLLLADVPYSSLAAARRVDVPAFALCSLHWGQALSAYCGERPSVAQVVEQIHDAYAGAEAFLQARPHAPMPDLANAAPIGPVFRRGRRRAEELRQRLGVGAETRLALAAFGGIAGPVAMGALPRRKDLLWLCAGSSGRDDVYSVDRLGLSFADLAASVDLVVTKAGYATVCETLAAGTRLLLAERPGWPESEAMRAFVLAQGTSATIAPGRLRDGGFAPVLDDLLARPRGPGLAPTGIEDACAMLAPRLAAGPPAVGG